MTRMNRDQLLALAKSEISELTIQELQRFIKDGDPVTIIDIRERDEFAQGHLPGAVFIPRGFLELQIEQVAYDRSKPVILYCAGGVRSVLAARNLKEMGYDDAQSLIGGFNAWKNAGLSFQVPQLLDDEQRIRYSRHILLDCCLRYAVCHG